MVSEGEKNKGFVVGHHHESYPQPPAPPSEQLPPPAPPPYYGTFQGIPTYQPHNSPAFGFPQPSPPPGASNPPSGQYYGYQTVPVAEGLPLIQRRRRLPCCGIGLGWILFIAGFVFGGIPWYVGAVLLIFSRGNLSPREKPGYILCMIAAVLATVAIFFGVTKGDVEWWD